MGHERTPMLPRSTRWRHVVDDLARYSRGTKDASSVAKRVLENVRGRFEGIADDRGVNAAFSFLFLMAYAAKQRESVSDLSNRRVDVTTSDSEIRIAKEINKWVEENIGSREYGELAKAAAIDAVIDWSGKIKTGQDDLFGKGVTNEDVWKKASDGSGFCELSRLFFSNFTERYLRYFLEREMGAQFTSWDEVGKLQSDLRNHLEKVSKFAFETSKITESFAAGWYNKHTKGTLPSARKLRGFIWLAFEKLREELRREKAAQ